MKINQHEYITDCAFFILSAAKSINIPCLSSFSYQQIIRLPLKDIQLFDIFAAYGISIVDS